MCVSVVPAWSARPWPCCWPVNACGWPWWPPPPPPPPRPPQRYDFGSAAVGALAVTTVAVARGQDPLTAASITAAATVTALVRGAEAGRGKGGETPGRGGGEGSNHRDRSTPPFPPPPPPPPQVVNDLMTPRDS